MISLEKYTPRVKRGRAVGRASADMGIIGGDYGGWRVAVAVAGGSKLSERDLREGGDGVFSQIKEDALSLV